MANPTLVNYESRGLSAANSHAITLASAPQAGSRLIAFVTYATGSGLPSITQTGVTWTRRAELGGSSPSIHVLISDHLAAEASANLTLTNSSSVAKVFHIMEFQGIHTDADPRTGANVGANGSSVTSAPGSITPGVNGAVILAVHNNESHTSETYTGPTGGFAVLDEETQSYGVGVYRNILSALIQTTAAAVNPTVTLSASRQWNACVVALKPDTSYVGPVSVDPDPPLASDPEPWEGALTAQDTEYYEQKAYDRLLAQFKGD